jgi:hypothetical protein
MTDTKRQFTLAGQAWALSIPIGLARRLKAELGIDLPNAWQRNWAGLQALLADPWQFCEVLWSLCERAATSRGITREAFETGLDDQSIAAAAEALQWAVVGFIPRGERAELLAAVKLTELAEANLQTKMDSPETAAAVGQLIDRGVAELLAEAVSRPPSGSSSPSSKPPSDATPGNTPSGS